MENAEKPIYPKLNFIEDGERLTIETYVRLKNYKDNKWYFKHLSRTYSVDLEKHFCVCYFVAEIYREFLFGVIGNCGIADPSNGKIMFELDQDQYSEHGRWYINDDTMFSKFNPPMLSFPGEEKPFYEKELVDLWEKIYKQTS